MSDRGRCEHCKWGTPIVKGLRPTGMYLCHAAPPIPVSRLVPSPQGMVSQIITCYAEVPPDHWCREFHPGIEVARQIPK